MPPEKPPREVKLTVPNAATQRAVLQMWEQVDRLPQPQDERSALVEREWTRIVGRRGKLTEWPMIGQQVTATFVDPPGDLFGTVRRVSGAVTRNDAGELVVRSDDGSETPVPLDANVDKGRGRSR